MEGLSPRRLAAVCHRPQGGHMGLEVTGVVSTELFVGTTEDPRQVVRVILAMVTGASPDVGPPVRVTVVGDGVVTPEPVAVSADVVTSRPDRPLVVEVPVVTEDRHPPGAEIGVRVLFDGRPAPGGATGTLVVAETGWTMVMVNHFHYDPVWWNTQAAYTSDWDRLDTAASGGPPRQQSGFVLMKAH